MVTVNPRGTSVVLKRWLFGMALVSWRYMWEIIPLHRDEYEGDAIQDAPPSLPTARVDDQLQLADEGVGPFYHRLFHVKIINATLSPDEVMRRIVRDFERFVPSEVIAVRHSMEPSAALEEGDEFVVEMPGPWNGPVRVVHATRTVLRLATLRGHLEAGQVEFRVGGGDTVNEFEIQAWARPSTQLVRWLYCVLRLAKEIQLNMWVRFCQEVATQSGGRLHNGVSIHTLQVFEPPRVQEVE